MNLLTKIDLLKKVVKKYDIGQKDLVGENLHAYIGDEKGVSIHLSEEKFDELFIKENCKSKIIEYDDRTYKNKKFIFINVEENYKLFCLKRMEEDDESER